MAPIKAEFGDGFVAQDGSLNRQQMRALVFRDGTAKLRLEAILHPAIRDEVSRQINLHSLQNQVPDCAEPKIVEKNPGMSPKLQQPTYVLLVAPLLFESLSYRNAVARTLVIDCPQHTQLMRVMQRPGMVADEVLRIMAAQIPRAIRLQLADDVLFNDKQTSDLDIPVDNLHRRFVGLANFRGAQYRSRAHVLSPTSNTNDITR